MASPTPKISSEEVKAAAEALQEYSEGHWTREMAPAALVALLAAYSVRRSSLLEELREKLLSFTSRGED